MEDRGSSYAVADHFTEVLRFDREAAIDEAPAAAFDAALDTRARNVSWVHATSFDDRHCHLMLHDSRVMVE